MNEPDLSYVTEEIRRAVATVLEGPRSPLCDCDDSDSLPTSPRTGMRLYHHCDCRAVASAAIVLGANSKTYHAHECGGPHGDEESTS